MGIGEGEADLDEVEEVDVGLEDGVVGGGVAEAEGFGGGADDDAGELGVHGDEGVPVDEEADQVEFGLDVVRPDRADYDRLRCRRRRRHWRWRGAVGEHSSDYRELGRGGG